MSANLSVPVIESSAQPNGGQLWHRLHSEREEICEALLKESRSNSQALMSESADRDEAMRDAKWHRELLQLRLHKLDDALDRLMCGEYGECPKCSRWIEDTKLDFDPAIAFCIDCWQRVQSKYY